MRRPHHATTALAALALSAATAARAAACQMTEVGELPIQFDHGRLLVEAQIDGRPAKMIVDTGATNTLIFRASAEAMGLPVHTITGMKFYGVGGEAGVAEVRIADFHVANFVAHDDDVLVSGKQPLGAEQGLLGADFLLQDDVEFDVAARRIRWFKTKGCVGDQVVYWPGRAVSAARMVGSGPLPGVEVTAQVNGVPVLAKMDTGAGASLLTPAAAARAGVTPASKGVAKVGETGGLGARAAQTYVGVFDTFSFGDETIKNARLEIADLFSADKEVRLGSHIPVAALEAPGMLLGADFFRSHRIYVSPTQRMVYVTYAGGPVFRPGPPPAPTP
jgi:clan AA aspartic protease (TIGR02281 family)